MRADKVEVSWDGGKSDWLVRIESGEEVIRRHFKASNNADENTLRTKAEETVKDEGYEANAAAVKRKIQVTRGPPRCCSLHNRPIVFVHPKISSTRFRFR